MLGWLFGRNKPDRATFAREVMDALARGGQPAPVEFDEGAFRLRLKSPAGEIGWMNLANDYDEYAAAPADKRPDRIRRTARSWLDRRPVPDVYAEARAGLVPRLKLRSFFEGPAREPVAGVAARIPWRPVGPWYGACVAWDSPLSVAMIDEKKLGKWGVEFDDALAVALANLRARPGTWTQAPSRAWLCQSADDHDAARVLLGDEISKLDMKDAPVAIPVSSTTLAVAGADDPEALASVWAAALKLADQPRFLGGHALRWTGKEWAEYLPPPDHPAFDGFKFARLMTLAGEYAAQQDRLSRTLPASGDPSFVAKFLVARKAEGKQTFSLSTLTKDVATLLPRTDVVHFTSLDHMDLATVVCAASWEAIEKVIPGYFRETDHWPPRYKPNGFPTEGQLAELREAEG
jgi:hypothetical protein